MTPAAAPAAPHWLPWIPISFAVAGGLALYFTPVLREAAQRFGIVDRPDGKLKTHGSAVAYLGGLAVYLAFLLTLGLSVAFERHELGLLLGASIVLLLGLIDDLKALSPAVKFLGQLLAAWVLLKAGIKIQITALDAYLPDALPPDLLTDAATVVWIVGVTNAFNIIDVMDGLAAGVGAVVLLALSAVALATGQPGIAVFTASLAGALAGFLRFNFRPATIYLGDAGSMLIGFLAGAVAMTLSYTATNPFAVACPLLILGVPIFDTVFVMILRWRRGLPVFRGSPDHFAVRLRKAGVSSARIACGAYAASALLGLAALWLMHLGRRGSEILLGATAAAALAAGIAISRIGSPGAAPARKAEEPRSTPPSEVLR